VQDEAVGLQTSGTDQDSRRLFEGSFFGDQKNILSYFLTLKFKGGLDKKLKSK
jgi:hypothetical protein